MAKIDNLKAELTAFKIRLASNEKELAIEIARGGFDTGKSQLIATLKAQVIELEREIKIESAAIVSVSASTNQIIKDMLEHRIIAPSWFVNNNINWVITGHITEQEFLTGYYHLIDQRIIQLPTPTVPTPTVPTPTVPTPVIELPEILPEVIAEPDSSITDNMVTQQMINFNIVNGRAVGSIRFEATNNFNPFYYGKNIVNIIQFKDPNGANILTYVKENRLNFTETERDEVITYDEDMQGNTRATVESFVWSSATAPTPFSKMYSIEISEAEPPKPITTGFMSAGVAGAIAGLVLLGFIIDHKVSKR